MASLGTSMLRPYCAACMRRGTRAGLESWGPGPMLQARHKSKAAKKADRNVVVKLLQDVPRYGREGAYVPIAPAQMRNRWFPMRTADYVPISQLKQVMASGVSVARDFEFGVEKPLEELDEDQDEDQAILQPRHYVRPVEIEMLSPARSMELLDTFIPSTIDFARQPIEQEQGEAKRRYGASESADILSAAALARTPKEANGIYGSVSTGDIVATVKRALAHNDEAARVVLSESNIRFLDGHGHAEGDSSRVLKQLGTFTVEIQVPGAETAILRSIRIRPKAAAE